MAVDSHPGALDLSSLAYNPVTDAEPRSEEDKQPEEGREAEPQTGCLPRLSGWFRSGLHPPPPALAIGHETAKENPDPPNNPNFQLNPTGGLFKRRKTLGGRQGAFPLRRLSAGSLSKLSTSSASTCGSTPVADSPSPQQSLTTKETSPDLIGGYEDSLQPPTPGSTPRPRPSLFGLSHGTPESSPRVPSMAYCTSARVATVSSAERAGGGATATATRVDIFQQFSYTGSIFPLASDEDQAMPPPPPPPPQPPSLPRATGEPPTSRGVGSWRARGGSGAASRGGVKRRKSGGEEAGPGASADSRGSLAAGTAKRLARLEDFRYVDPSSDAL